MLGDRCYCSYFMIALLLRRKVDVVARLHQARHSDFCRGRDRVVTWQRPQKPDWMDQATYAQMPESIQVREVHVQVDQPGFRVASLIVVTTLTDALKYTKDDVAELYHQRWLVEVFFREMKGQLGLCDYQGTRFESYERYITLALLGFLTLEYERMRGLQKQSASAEPRGGWAAARTAALLQSVRHETLRADVKWQQDCLKTVSGRRRLKKALAEAA